MELGSDFELDVSELNYCNDHIFSYLEPYHTLYMDSGRSAAKLLNTMIPEGVILYLLIFAILLSLYIAKDLQLDFIRYIRIL